VTTVYGSLSRWNARQREQALMAPASAQYQATVRVEGHGDITPDDPHVNFGTLFLERPHFTYGVVALAPLTATPLVSAVVASWAQTDRGLYYGAYLRYRVHLPEGVTGDVPVLQFDLTFAGVAVRTTRGFE